MGKKKLNFFEFNNFYNIYKILLFGSTISGKTSYCNYCEYKSSIPTNVTIGIDKVTLHPSYDQNISVILYDVGYYILRRDMYKKKLKNSDGVLLLFDITSRKDFEELNYYLDKIKEGFFLDNFPVLLIANKIEEEYEKK